MDLDNYLKINNMDFTKQEYKQRLKNDARKKY